MLNETFSVILTHCEKKKQNSFSHPFEYERKLQFLMTFAEQILICIRNWRISGFPYNFRSNEYLIFFIAGMFGVCQVNFDVVDFRKKIEWKLFGFKARVTVIFRFRSALQGSQCVWD